MDLISPPDNAVLTAEECRQWLRMDERPFADGVRTEKIPYIKALGQKNKKFHVGTVKRKLRMGV